MICLYFYLLLKKNREFVSGRKESIYPVMGEISGIWHRKGRIQLFIHSSSHPSMPVTAKALCYGLGTQGKFCVRHSSGQSKSS